MSLIHNRNSKSDQELRKFESMLLNRVTISDFKYETSNIMNNCAKNSDLNNVRNIVLPAVDGFKTKIEQFEKSNDESKEIIKRFDEVICEKASKIDVTELIKQLKDYVKKDQFLTIYEFKDSVVEDLDLMYTRISDIHKETKEMLQGMVTKASTELRRQIVSDLGGNPVHVDELKTFLNLKVDKVEFNRCNNLKANKSDFKGITASIDMLRKQLK